MKQFPNNVTFDKNHKRKTQKGTKAKSLSLFTSGMSIKKTKAKSLNLSHKHLETMRRILVRCLRPKGKKRNLKNLRNKVTTLKKRSSRRRRRNKTKPLRFKLRYNFYSPVTKKPLQVRMGKGKGSPHIWVYPTSNARVLLEISRKRLSLQKMLQYSKKTSIILPSKTKFIFERQFVRREHNYKLHSLTTVKFNA
jgi:ribosomal protein L16/L10AE